MRKERFKGFVMGVLCTCLVISSAAVGFAQVGNKTVTAAYNNIKIYINQKLITPKDANGNTVEPFIINGTTYLPVRAVASALGQEVSWNGVTNSVYIGTQPEKTDMEKAMELLGGKTWGKNSSGMSGYKYVFADGYMYTYYNEDVEELILGMISKLPANSKFELSEKKKIKNVSYVSDSDGSYYKIDIDNYHYRLYPSNPDSLQFYWYEGSQLNYSGSSSMSSPYQWS